MIDGLNFNFSAIGVFESIADQIEKYLSQTVFIAIDPNAFGELMIKFNFDIFSRKHQHCDKFEPF